jgi:hypothetical protein
MKIIKSSKPDKGIAFKRFYKNKIINTKDKKKNKKTYNRVEPAVTKEKKVTENKPYKGKPTNGAKCAKKRARKLGRLSVFADYSAITYIYLECRRLNIKAGRHAYDVDHIIPFFAGGLHHEYNLQIMRVPEHKIKTLEDMERYGT